ncbi:MAG TPA: ROK family transcriptional regulator [Longimicrobiaceae bacterium]|nr:ROK family transcriptional regulator [Longimicrobiaceae bacterium]
MRKINTRSFHLATRSTAREVNRQIVLNLVREHQPISRADLARRMGVARGSVTPLVRELLADGLIYEGSVGDTSRGRKPTLLYVRTRDRLAVGIDVRFSRTSVLLSDFGGREIATETFSTPLDPAELTAELVRRVLRLVETHAEAGECEGVGLVVPGMVDRRTAVVLNAPTLGWRDVDLRAALTAAIGLPVFIDRDAAACALAHMWLSQASGDGVDNFVYLTVSDGVGTSLVVNGEVLRGYRSTAGEFGHVPLSLDGPQCACGARGCLEAYASNRATLARYLGRDLSSPGAYAQLRGEGLEIPDLVARARSGDAAATSALRETGRYLGVGIANIVNSISPARIVVGGEITAAWDLIEPAVRESVRERTLTAASAATPVVVEAGDAYLRLRGASALVVAPVFVAPRVA